MGDLKGLSSGRLQRHFLDDVLLVRLRFQRRGCLLIDDRLAFISIGWTLFGRCVLLHGFLHRCRQLAPTEDQLVLEQQGVVLRR